MTETLVRGVLDASGAGFSRFPPDPWCVILQLCPWRREGGEVVATPIYLKRVLPDGPDSYPEARALAPLTVITVRCRLDEQAEVTRATLLSIELEATRDDELERAAADLRRPVAIESAFLGTLTLERALGWFRGTRKVDGTSYEVNVVRSGASEESDAADGVAAEALVKALEPRLGALRLATAEQLLELYNDTWREEEAAVETAASFAARIVLASVTVHPEGGTFTLWFDDDDLFAGHSLEVCVRADGTVDASLAG
ncbi:MAG: DUF2262 domain-containing protein [Polyangiaceae bacterium]|nr:DUF2262 domain-containing protein [Polyangiaceae bacterium]